MTFTAILVGLLVVAAFGWWLAVTFKPDWF
jgi:hypothetical protein